MLCDQWFIWCQFFTRAKLSICPQTLNIFLADVAHVLRLCSPVQMQSMIDDSQKLKSLQYAANEVAVCCTSIRPGLVSKPDGLWQLLPL